MVSMRMLLEARPVQRALKDGKAQAARLNVKYAQQDAANTCLDKILALIAAMELSARLLDSPQLRVLIARLATTLAVRCLTSTTMTTATRSARGLPGDFMNKQLQLAPEEKLNTL